MVVLCSYVFIFFFFKQKTAYEMCISDWSSDVCSSDLQGKFVEEAPVQHRHARHLRQFGRRSLGAAVVDRGKPAQPRLAEQGHVDAERQRAQTGVGADIARRLFAADMLLAGRPGQHATAFAKIGRASGRERVSKSGYISGVAVTIKKKKD